MFKVTSFTVHPSSFLLYSKHILNQIQSCFGDHDSLYSHCVVCLLWLLVCLWGTLFSLSSLWILTCCSPMCANLLFTACQQITCQNPVGSLWYFSTSKEGYNAMEPWKHPYGRDHSCPQILHWTLRNKWW